MKIIILLYSAKLICLQFLELNFLIFLLLLERMLFLFLSIYTSIFCSRLQFKIQPLQRNPQDQLKKISSLSPWLIHLVFNMCLPRSTKCQVPTRNSCFWTVSYLVMSFCLLQLEYKFSSCYMSVFAHCLSAYFLNTGSEVKWSEVTQSCPTLCNPMDCSLLRSSVHGIFQARVLEWVAIAFSISFFCWMQT